MELNTTSLQANIVSAIPESVTDEQLAQSRGRFVQVDDEAYGAGKDYAGALIAHFRKLGFGDRWLTMAHDEKSAAGNAMREERDALYTELRARPKAHSNPSVKWKQIRDHGNRILSDIAKAEAIAAGEPEAEAEGGKAKHTRSLQLRLVQDLKTLYNACKREKARTDAQTQAFTHISSALKALSVDLNTI